MHETDVLVVGAGPTGLMLACELALVGVRVRVLERRTEEPNITRAFAVHARTLELMDGRGLAEQLQERGVSVESVAPVPGALLDLTKEVKTRYPMILIVPQSGTEKVLEARAEQLGVAVVEGAKLTGLRQTGAGPDASVEVDVEQDGKTTTERATYVVGCDGAHSTVRDLIGVDFVGAQYETHIMLADVQFAGDIPQGLFGRTAEEGVVLSVPYGDGWFRAIAWDRRRDTVALSEPVTGAEMRDAYVRIAGTDFGMSEPKWTSRFLSERRQARTYRVGNVFLAGDAAHVHSPLGGQGMNTGLQDAYNLGWKLAAVVHGWGPGWLLDTYQKERHPVGERVLALTDLFVKLVLGYGKIRRAVRTFATRNLLRIPKFRHEIAGRLTGVGIRYEPVSPSAVVRAQLRRGSWQQRSAVGGFLRAGARPGRDDAGDRHWAGRRMPDIPAGDGRLYERLATAHFLLVDTTGNAELAQAVEPYKDRVELVTAAPAAGVPAVVLVRPDGYVAWAVKGEAGVPAQVGAALTEWCGPA